MNNFEVKEVNPEEDAVNLALGISEERHNELCSVMKDEFEKDGATVTSIFEDVSKHVRNANELGYMFFRIGSVFERKTRINNPVSALADLLGGLR